MYCQNCGEGLEEGWRFCPSCGNRIGGADIASRFPGFERVFEDLDREFWRIGRLFKDLKPDEGEFAKGPLRGGGISIHIESGAEGEPKVEVKTFGEFKEHEGELRERLGILKEGEEGPPRGVKRRRVVKATEEPETSMKRIDDALLFKVKVPGVASEDDVEIQRVGESIEIRAYAKDKAYFTLFSLPEGAQITSRRLEGEELVIEMKV